MIFLIKYGFHMEFNPVITLNHEIKIHKSASDHPQDIEAYLKEEIQFQAILGPYSDSPVNNIHVSPFMTRDKPGAKHRQVIVYPSFPL